MVTTQIILSNVTVQQYGKTVLNNISFKLNAGEHLAIIGSSGSGKTTLAKAIASQIFYKGNIDVYFSNNTSLNKKIIFAQHSEKLKNLSNTSNFYYQQRFNSCDADDASTLQQELQTVQANQTQTNKLLQQFNLLHRLHTPLIQLSNGEQKKLQLIKVLLQQPQILILDKAFTGLDFSSRQQLHTVLNKLAKNGTTIILITDEKEIPACITHIAELGDGKLLRFAEKENFCFEENNNEKKFLKPLPVISTEENFTSIIEMKNVTVKYGEKIILNNINWKILQGEKWLVKGCNGAGKSTLLSLITADNPQAYANEIYLFGKKRGKGESIWDIKKRIGFVSPELHKYFDAGATVYQTVASGFFDTIGLYKNLSTEQKIIVDEWLNFFELTPLQHQQFLNLSAGQQRWVLLARALVKQPLLLVLDEPCQGLDEQHISEFISIVDEICRQSNTTLIYVSHYENEVPECISKVFELNNGIQTIYKKEKNKVA